MLDLLRRQQKFVRQIVSQEELMSHCFTTILLLLLLLLLLLRVVESRHGIIRPIIIIM